MSGMRDEVEQTLLTQEQIQKRVTELGRILSEEYAGKNPIPCNLFNERFRFRL